MPRDFMRAFYSRRSVSIYDLQKHEWVEKGGQIEDSLKAAKATAQEKTSLMLGKTAPGMTLH